MGLFLSQKPPDAALGETQSLSKSEGTWLCRKSSGCHLGGDTELANIMGWGAALQQKREQTLGTSCIGRAGAYVCREFQKRTSLDQGVAADGDTLLDALYAGHCSAVLTKQKRGFHRKLSDEFSDVSQERQEPPSSSFKEHCAGDDAAMCARVFLHHKHATVQDSIAAHSAAVARADKEESAAKRRRLRCT